MIRVYAITGYYAAWGVLWFLYAALTSDPWWVWWLIAAIHVPVTPAVFLMTRSTYRRRNPSWCGVGSD